MIFDTNVVIDIIDDIASADVLATLARLRSEHEVVINEIVFAEISGRFEAAQHLNELLDLIGVRVARLSLEECHRAGQAFRAYRRAGGARTTILPDFLIGAQAEAQGWPIVTRDRKGFAKYFPRVELIDPYEELR